MNIVSDQMTAVQYSSPPLPPRSRRLALVSASNHSALVAASHWDGELHVFSVETELPVLRTPGALGGSSQLLP